MDEARTEIPTRTDADLLYEMGTLRHVPRMWSQFGGLPMANDAEHSFRTAWIAWILATREGADIQRCVMMALLHDVAETRTGDVNYLSRMYTRRDEDGAMQDQFGHSVIAESVTEFWTEYKERSTLEAKVAKDADTLDCDLELQEAATRGEALGEALMDTRTRVRELLYTDSARKLFDEIYAVSPHHWHVTGKNRLTAGDWSKPV